MKRQKVQAIGLERIYRLFELAEQELEQHPERSRRYVQLALAISKKSRARVPDELKTKFCKKCNSFLREGYNSKITKEKTTLGEIALVKCLGCGFERKTGRKVGTG